MQKISYRRSEIPSVTGFTQTKVDRLIHEGLLPSFRIGRSVMVTHGALTKLVGELERKETGIRAGVGAR